MNSKRDVCELVLSIIICLISALFIYPSLYTLCMLCIYVCIFLYICIFICTRHVEKTTFKYIWFWIRNVAEVVFEYALIPWNFLFQPSYEDEFLPCEKHDAVLVIGKRKLHVNKAFLSYHSDYFRALFSSSFKENEQYEIELKDVVYEDFGLLMSTIYPKPVFPTDRTVKKILVMADRFLVQSAIDHVEHHLLHNSSIASESMIWMADKYGMETLLEKSIKEIDSLPKLKILTDSPLFPSMSHDTKVMVLERLMNLI